MPQVIKRVETLLHQDEKVYFLTVRRQHQRERVMSRPWPQAGLAVSRAVSSATSMNINFVSKDIAPIWVILGET